MTKHRHDQSAEASDPQELIPSADHTGVPAAPQPSEVRTVDEERAPAAQPSNPASAAQSSEARVSISTEATSSAPPST